MNKESPSFRSLFCMNISRNLQTFSFSNHSIKVVVPDADSLQQWYAKKVEAKGAADFPYWGKIWPAANALCSFISNHTELLKDKQVLELAAGVGLPSLLSAFYAKEVCCSDYNADAVTFINESILENKLQNISARVIDWNHLAPGLTADVLLVSDINYEPGSFETLFKVLIQFLNSNTTILLSTPQRLMAKPFIEQLLPFCKQQEEVLIKTEDDETMCSVFLLKK